MHYYAATWQQIDSDIFPNFPAEIAGIIDLRPDTSVVDGYCFVSSDFNIGDPPGGLYFGDDLSVSLPNSLRQKVSNALGFSVRGLSIQDVLIQTLIEEGRDDGTRWRPLKPRDTGENQWEIWLGGTTPAYSVPRVQGGATAADTFNRADGDLAGRATDEGWFWQETRGYEWAIIGNRAKLVNGSQASYARCELPMGTENNRAGFTLVTYFGGTNTQVGACMRMQSTSDDCYLVMRDMTASGTRLKIRKSTNGSRSDISALFDVPYVTNEVLEGRCDGSTISLIHNGTVISSATDTTYASGGRTGIYGFWNSGTCSIEIDDFFSSEWPIETVGGLAKVNLAGSWTEKPAKVYLNDVWTQKPAKHHNGTSWV